MPITITYKLHDAKLKKAVNHANKMLASDDLPRIIRSRSEPFDESEPPTLPPGDVADYAKNSNLALTLCEYNASSSSIGGMFTTRTPRRMHANRRAVPLRHECNLARMLVHEAIHALSYDVQNASFSHDDKHPVSAHRETAPYWIQAKLRPLCPGIADDELIEVELVLDDDADLSGRDIQCE